jgi:DNA-binding response OmpR family regulator
MSRILIVEDDPAIAIALEDDLRMEGYSVELVHDGEAASQRGRREAFDLILLDVMLPKKDGFEVCRELRRAGVESIILMLTARTQEAEKVLGLDIGADDYVTKPYSPKELRARIRAFLRRVAPEDSTADVVRFGECEVRPIRPLTSGLPQQHPDLGGSQHSVYRHHAGPRHGPTEPSIALSVACFGCGR